MGSTRRDRGKFMDRTLAAFQRLTAVYSAGKRTEIERIVLHTLMAVGFDSARLYYLATGKRLVAARAFGVPRTIQRDYARGKVLLKWSRAAMDQASFRVLSFGKPLLVRVDTRYAVNLRPHRATDSVPSIEIQKARYTPYLARRPDRSWIDFPLLANGIPFGKITLDNANGSPVVLSSEQYRLLESLVQPVSDALCASGWFTSQSLPSSVGEHFRSISAKAKGLVDLLMLASRHIVDCFNANQCSIFLVHRPVVPKGILCPQPERLVLWETTFANLKPKRQLEFYEKGEGLTGHVWKDGKPAFRADLTKVRCWRAKLNDSLEHEGYVAAPIVGADNCILGLVRIPEGKTRRLLDRDSSILYAFARDHLAPEIEQCVRRQRGKASDALTDIFARYLGSLNADSRRIGSFWKFARDACMAAFGNRGTFVSRKLVAYSVADGNMKIEVLEGDLPVSRQYVNKAEIPRTIGSAAARVLETGMPLLLTDVKAAELRGAYIPLIDKVRNVMVVPLMDGGQPFGALALVSGKYDLLADQDLPILIKIAQMCQIGHGIEQLLKLQRYGVLESLAYELKTPAALLNAHGKSLQRKVQGQVLEEHSDVTAADVLPFLSVAHWVFNTAERILISLGQPVPHVNLAPMESAVVVSSLMQTSKAFLDLRNTRGLRLNPVSSVNGLRAICQADIWALATAIIEVLDNAIKASPDDGLITWSAACNRRFLCISVRDQGCGMTPRTMKNAIAPGFHVPFGKEDGTRLSQGFGLTVADRIMRAHGGHLLLDSDGSNYSEVSIRLPIRSEVRGSRHAEQSIHSH